MQLKLSTPGLENREKILWMWIVPNKQNFVWTQGNIVIIIL